MAASEFSGLIPYAVNFSIVVGAALYYGATPFKKFVYQRHERQRDLIDAAALAKKNAEKRFIELQENNKSLSETSRRMLQEAEASARQEAEQILKRAEMDIVRLKQDADRIISNEAEQKGSDLKNKIIGIAIQKAETSLRSEMKKEHHSEILRIAKRSIETELSNG